MRLYDSLTAEELPIECLVQELAEKLLSGSRKHFGSVLLCMGGPDQKQDEMFSYVSPDKRVPADHPLRKIRPLVDQVLKGMSPQFGKLYSAEGRPSIAPERLLRTAPDVGPRSFLRSACA